MYNEKNIIAMIPARAGSKGIINKNLVDLNGKPLIQYTIEVAKQSKYIDQVLVSTDGEEIAQISESLGAYVPFLRPEELANDTSKTIDAIYYTKIELIKRGEYFDSIVLLQPTSPSRTLDELDEAIEKYYQYNKNLVSVSEAKEHPIMMRTINEQEELIPMLEMKSDVRRQEFSKYYIVDGSIYINDFDALTDRTSFNDNPLPFISRNLHIDIDTLEDLHYARYCMKCK